jgi:hypothetical protein
LRVYSCWLARPVPASCSTRSIWHRCDPNSNLDVANFNAILPKRIAFVRLVHCAEGLGINEGRPGKRRVMISSV